MSAPRLTARIAPVAVLLDQLVTFDPQALADRGAYAVYHHGETNRCPRCGRSHWQVGRTMAECAFCETALPIADDGREH